MTLWIPTRSRRSPMIFASELRRLFAAKIIQKWWLNVKSKKTIHDNTLPYQQQLNR